MAEREHDAVVVGSGPNGLTAAVTLARAGHSVLVVEAEEQLGGGARSAPLTLPGFVHDVCSAVHPLGVGSRVFDRLPLDAHGLEWVHPAVPLAHPLDDGSAAVLHRSVADTAAGLGEDEAAYRRVVGPFVKAWDDVAAGLVRPFRWPRQPLALAQSGALASLPASALGRAFRESHAAALFAGCAAHAIQPFDRPATAAFGLGLMAAGHAVGWPVARGGSQHVTDALAAHLHELGGEIVTGWRVESLDELPRSRAVLCDVTPRQLLDLAGDRLASTYRRRLRGYRQGPGVCKLDLALDGPVPWTAPACREAGTVHVGGELSEVAQAERLVADGVHPERPFVLVAQQSVCDDTRAPSGQHTVWAYCHVPNGSERDMSDRVEAQIERFAPDFRDRIIARSVHTAADLQRINENNRGGDIAGGSFSPLQLLARALRPSPYTTPDERVLLCSSSSPPGPGVHGLCGYHAARAALRGPLRSGIG